MKPSGWVDGHPASSKLNLFEGFVKKIVDVVKANPELWESTAIFVTFDEGGGYYDSGYVQPLDFFGDGTRIPHDRGLAVHQSRAHLARLYRPRLDPEVHRAQLERLRRSPAAAATISPILYTASTSKYAPINGPAIGDMFDYFNFGGK